MPRPPAPYIRFKDSRCVKENCANLVYLQQWRVLCKTHGEIHHYEEKVPPYWADGCREYDKKVEGGL